MFWWMESGFPAFAFTEQPRSLILLSSTKGSQQNNFILLKLQRWLGILYTYWWNTCNLLTCSHRAINIEWCENIFRLRIYTVRYTRTQFISTNNVGRLNVERIQLIASNWLEWATYVIDSGISDCDFNFLSS